MLSAAEVRDKLKNSCETAGSQSAWAKLHGLSGPYVNDVIHGRREPGAAICEALGIERVIAYRMVA